MDQPTLHIMVGLPRSGKSTQASVMSNDTGAPIVCPDEIRLAMHGQSFIGSMEPYVWAVAKTMTKALFGAGHRHVILDATNTSRKRRDEWISRSWRREFHVVNTPAKECKRRPGGDVLAEIIDRMEAQYEPVHPTEREQ